MVTKDIKTAKSTQEIANLGFDTEFNLPVIETLVYNPTSSSVERMTQPGSEAKQDSQIALETTLNSLIETLQELAQRLAPLAGAMANNAAIRVSGAGGSYGVTGPITSAQSIAEKNTAGVAYTTRVATENLNAINSNINNVSITN